MTKDFIMRNYIVFFIIIIFVYGIINYYIGLRFLKAFKKIFSFNDNKLYWFLYWPFPLSFVVGRMLPGEVGIFLSYIGAYWIAFMVNCAMIFVAIDLFRIINRYIGVLPDKIIKDRKIFAGIFSLMLVLLLGIMIYGSWNASNPRITSYDINIDKQRMKFGNLKIVMISDIHLGFINGKDRLNQYIDKINEQEADIVVIDGDIIDQEFSAFEDNNMGEAFRRIKTRYGVYAILGNHDYFSGHADDLARSLEANNVILLRDKVLKIEDSFYLLGREDKSFGRADGSQRKDLAYIKNGLDENLPMILLDHQPTSIDEAVENGIDLQLSGHTHHGQLLPVKYIVESMYEKAWGYLRKDKFQLIVSSGVGTWGPPIRTGTISEIVVINLNINMLQNK